MDGAQFNGVIATAANIPANGETGTYTVEMFLEDFPQFSKAGMKPREPLVPEGILCIFIGNANRSILQAVTLKHGDMQQDCMWHISAPYT